VSAVYLQQFPSYSNHNCKKSSFLRTPAFMWQSRKTLHGWEDSSVLAKPLAACTIFNSFRVIRCLSQCVVQKSLFSPHFCLPWGRPCGNHAKRCMNEKTAQCLPNPSQHVPVIFNSFPVIRTASAKNCRFHVLQATFLFPLM